MARETPERGRAAVGGKRRIMVGYGLFGSGQLGYPEYDYLLNDSRRKYQACGTNILRVASA